MKQADLALLEAPVVVRRSARKRATRKNATGTAAQTLGPLESGCEIFAFTKGQFSLTDVLLHVLDQTGPADVVVSTWTAAHADIQTHHRLLACGAVRSVRFIVDRGFPSRQPEYCDLLVAKFSPDCIRVTKTHAKFALVHNEKWSVVIRTSMNLNHNPRFENVEISEDSGFLAFMLEIVDEVFRRDDCGVRLRDGGAAKAVDIPRADGAFAELWPQLAASHHRSDTSIVSALRAKL